MLRTAPGRGASTTLERWVAKRWRHFPTVTGFTPRSEATSRSVFPSAQPRMIRQRRARDWAEECRRATLESLAFLVGEGDLNGRSSATRHGRLLLQGFYQLERDRSVGKFPIPTNSSSNHADMSLGLPGACGLVVYAVVPAIALYVRGCKVREGAEPLDFFGLVQLLGFVKAPGGMLLLRVGPALGTRLHSYLDSALLDSAPLQTPMTSLFHEPLPTSRGCRLRQQR